MLTHTTYRTFKKRLTFHLATFLHERCSNNVRCLVPNKVLLGGHSWTQLFLIDTIIMLVAFIIGLITGIRLSHPRLL